MKRIVISGYYGFRNAGDEAMLTALIEALRRYDPDLALTVMSADPARTQAQHGIKAIDRMDIIAITKALANCDLLLSGGGSLLQNASSKRSLYYYLGVIKLAYLLGKPVMFYAQGIGPINGGFSRFLVRCTANQAKLITVRDQSSQWELAAIGVKKVPIQLTADPVLALTPAEPARGEEILRKAGVEVVRRPILGIAVREWKEQGSYKEAVARLGDDFIAQRGGQVVFLPMHFPDDLKTSRAIMAMMRHPAACLEEEYTAKELLAAVGHLDLLVGMRLHALIFAALMHVPMVGISYDPKVDGFIQSIGQRVTGPLSRLDFSQLHALVEQTWQERTEIRQSLAAQTRELRRLALLNAELAVGLLRE